MNDVKTSAETALVIGASGAIGEATVRRFLADERYHVVAVSRQASGSDTPGLDWRQVDHSEASMEAVAAYLSENDLTLARVVICTGVLHGDTFGPEKKIEQLSTQAMRDVFDINAFLPAAWLRALTPNLLRTSAVVSVLSARVGSIDDNRSGGWYSYRASKAALNMLLKSLSVEYARRAPKVKLLAFHPGTTDSPLSRPFQKNVPEGKLFTPDFVAERLAAIMDAQHADGSLSFLDWQGKTIGW